uniref:LINE-1 type transposase domain-containing 1 n=1 Tax=Knipowitschia caucasica TaxID=637954 RepID=A0AAV2LHQ7_KNICA
MASQALAASGEEANDSRATQNSGEDAFSMSLLMAELAKHQANMHALIQESIKPLQASVDSLNKNVKAFHTRLASTEVRVGENFEKLIEVDNQIHSLEKYNSALLNKVEDLENRSRRANLRVLNIPEKSEDGKGNIVFLSDLQKDAMGPDIFPSPPELERAHRIGPITGKFTRPFITCFHHYRDKEAVLRWSRQNQMKFGGNVLRVYPDLSAALVKKRAEFKPIKALLYAKGVQFRLLYPAQLKIVHNGESRTISSSEDATVYYKQFIASG